MKTILNNKSILVKIILTLIITTISILNALSVPASATEVKTHTNYRNDLVTEYKDYTTVINYNTNVYELYITAMGDWNFSCNNEKELNNLIAEYKSHIDGPSDLVNTVKYVQEINRYTKPNGNIIVEFNNNSCAIYNEKNNLYEFYPAETTDEAIACDNMKQLDNCINTYLSIKWNGYF